MPDESIHVLGRLSNHPCFSRRCLICHSYKCGHVVKDQNHLVCYHTSGPEGVYIRRGQLDFADMCTERNELCSFQVLPDNTVKRGCALPAAEADGVILCDTHLCNTFIAGLYCYTCQATDPNCVFSQHEGPFEMCPPPALGCFTRIFVDNSVQRGCAYTKSDDSSLSSVFEFCDTSSLCNGKSMRSHSCHFLQVGMSFQPPVNIPQKYLRDSTQTGWLFESCVDEMGLPACYLKVDIKNLTYGCTADLSTYELVSYKRGMLLPSMIFCDGHYCNEQPERKDWKKKIIWTDRADDLGVF